MSAAAFSASVTAAAAATMASAEFVDDVGVLELDRDGVAARRGREGSGRVRAAEGRREREADEEELQVHAGAARRESHVERAARQSAHVLRLRD